MSQQTTPERIMSIGLFASLIAGLIVGIGARILMRIVALTAHMQPGFSIEGTLNIVFLVFILGTIPGLVYAVCLFCLSSFTKTSKYLPSAFWRGLAYGALLLVVLGLPSVLIPLLPTEDLSLGIPLLNKSMFAALALIYGLVLGGTEALLHRYLPGKPTSAKKDLPAPLTREE